MKSVTIISRIVGRGAEGIPTSAKGTGEGIDLSTVLQKSVWDKVFEIKTDLNGVEYLFSKMSFVSQYGLTAYGDPDGLEIGGIYAGLPIDNKTIYWDNGVLKAKGGEGGGGGVADSVAWVDVYGKPSWITENKPVYAYSEILNAPTMPTALSQLANDMGYVTEGTVNTLRESILRKQDAIEDLDNIRAGAAKGATAVQPEVLDNYLPLTGGNVEGDFRVMNAPGALILVNTTNGEHAALSYRGGSMWYISNNNWAADYKLWHEGNFNPNNYFPLTGDAIANGFLYLKKDLGGNLDDWFQKQHDGPFEVGRKSNSMTVAIGVTDDNFGYIQSKGMGIISNGDLVLQPASGGLYYSKALCRIWHEGNDGSGSGLDADTLDGMHGYSYFRSLGGFGDNTDFNNVIESGVYINTVGNYTNYQNEPFSYGYLLVFNTGNGYAKSLQIATPHSGNEIKVRQFWADGWTPWKSLAFTDGNVESANFATRAGSADKAVVVQGIETTDFSGTDLNESMKLFSGILAGTEGLYPYESNANAVLTINKHPGNYNSQLGFSSNGLLYYRNGSNEVLSNQPWKRIAFTDTKVDAAVSADKLQTPTKLWGNKFDGSGSIDGSIFMASNNAIYGTTAEGIQESCLIPRWSDGKTYFNYGSGGLVVRNNNNEIEMVLNASGNVGIGTDDPNYELDILNNGEGLRLLSRNDKSVMLMQNAGGMNWEVGAMNNNIFAIRSTVWNGNVVVCNHEGNVGFGTSTLSARVNVGGSAYVSENLSIGGNAIISGNLTVSSNIIKSNVYRDSNGSWLVGRVFTEGSERLVIGDASISEAIKIENQKGYIFIKESGSTEISGLLYGKSGLDLTGVLNQRGGECRMAMNSYVDPAPGFSGALKLSGGFAQDGGRAILCASSGNVLIGTTTDSGHRLSVNGTASISGDTSFGGKLNVSGNTTLEGNVAVSGTALISGHSLRCRVLRDGANQWIIGKMDDADGAIGVGSVNLTQPIKIENKNGNAVLGSDGNFSVSKGVNVSGNILVGGGVTMYSQRSLKNVVDERGLSLDELATIKPTRYTWKDGRDERVHIGGIADDVERVMPEVIQRTKDGVLTMDYACAAFAVAASLIQPVSDHERRIGELERENRTLREELELLKKVA